MFIFNVKVNKKEIFKYLLIIMVLLCIALTIAASINIFKDKKDFEILVEDCMPKDEIARLTDENYTNILKEVHENLDTYIGQQISYTGYVYRVPNLQKNEFILARDMRLNKETDQTVVVGFLCNLEDAENYENYSWVNITGTIEKGYYFGDIPCIRITTIEKTKKPEKSIVPEPNDKFVQTSVIY